MGRRGKTREQLIADVVKAWNTLPQRSKPEIMGLQPELYYAVAWLAAHETARAER